MKKNTIFISYSIPEDVFAARWLASKIKQMGYNVWVEVDDLKPGESFWPVIENVLRSECIKFLPILTESYLEKARSTDRTGIRAELSLANAIKKGTQRFIVPLKFSNFDYSEVPIDLSDLDIIDFSSNWAKGFKELIELLEEDEIEKSPQESVLNFWYKSQGIKSNVIFEEEDYYTNWFQLQIPTTVYFHYPNILDDKSIYCSPYRVMKIDNKLLSFADQDGISEYMNLRKDSVSVDTNDFLNSSNLKISEDIEIGAPRSLIVGLIHKTIEDYLILKRLQYYKLSNRKRIFFFPHNKEGKRVSLKKFGKTSRGLSGRSTSFFWHYAISINFKDYPENLLVINHHLVFKDSNMMYTDQETQMKLRRSLPSDWYNRHWLERMLAFMVKLSDDSDMINIETGADQNIEISSVPLKLISPVSYDEPI